MNKIITPLGLAGSIFLLGLILARLPFDESRIVQPKLDDFMRQDAGFRQKISGECEGIAPAHSQSSIEKVLVQKIAQQSLSHSTSSCSLSVEGVHEHRFFLRGFAHYYVRLQAADGQLLFQKDYAFSYPRPLVLLPLLSLPLALLFGASGISLVLLIGVYLVFLSGGSLLSAFDQAKESISLVLQERSIPAFFLFALWIILLKRKKEKFPESTQPNWLSKGVLLLGLWNPTSFGLLGTWFRNKIGAQAAGYYFLLLQTWLACASIYLFVWDTYHWKQWILQGLLLPRYFTFASILFVLVLSREIKQTLDHNQMPAIRWTQSLLWFVLFEVVAQFFSFSWMPSTFTRLALALTLSEISVVERADIKSVAKQALPWWALTFAGVWLSNHTAQTGVLDTIMVLLDPRVHPSAVPIYTFLAGAALGYCTGNFSAAFFTLFAVALDSQALPLVRAALLDGILVGLLLSPISLINLLPARQFGWNAQEIFAHRLSQIAAPLGIASFIYLIGSINSVSILRPVSFVFLSMVSLTWFMRRQDWQLTHYNILDTPIYQGGRESA